MGTKRWLVVAIFCVGLVLVLGLIKFMQIRAAIAFGESFPEPSETVEFEVAAYGEWQPEISVIGDVKASREVQLRNEVEGIIAEIGFESGAEVQAGEVLLQLDISEEQAQLAAIQPEIELARQNVERVSGLANKSAVSRQQADDFKSQLAIARAQAASVREVIANKTVVAPFTGYAGLHDFEVGEFLPASTLITNLVGELETLWVDFSLPQRYAQLSLGTLVTVSTTDNAGQAFTATVTAVEPSISSESRNLLARAVLMMPERRIKPGTVVQVSTPVGASQQVIRLPNTAVRVDTFGPYVFVLQSDAENNWRASRRPVSVIAKQLNQSIISSGIEPGETIAATGSFKLREGLLVYQAADRDQTQTEPILSAVDSAVGSADQAQLVDAESQVDPVPTPPEESNFEANEPLPNDDAVDASQDGENNGR